MKARVTLAGVPLSATSSVVWRFVSGVAPYTTTFTVHQTQWQQSLKRQLGQPLTLRIEDSRGVAQEVKDVYILHRAPSDSPYRVSFVVADKRWKWPYKLIARDFNTARKTGDRTAKKTVPVETRQTVDQYDYLPHTLNDGRRWTAKDAVRWMLDQLNDDRADRVTVESFPIEGDGAAGQFTLQNVALRDQGDVALSRLLGYVPGADVYVDSRGVVTVFDATDLDGLERYYATLPQATYEGDAIPLVKREAIRPARVVVHFQREVELLLDFTDDYGGTSADPGRNTPFLENVIPTVDPSTSITEYDPEEDQTVTKDVPPGTWVRVDKWLAAMDADRPEGSLPWTWDTIRRHWLKGDLDGVLGARGLDQDDEANVAMRVQALKQHFRQTFRINRRYMQRVRSLQSVRVGLLDPVTGARAPAAVWGEACIVPTTKGARMAARRDPARAGVFRNVDYLKPSENGADIIDTAPGPAAVSIQDRDLGIFRVEWLLSPYGTVESFVPCHLKDARGQQTVVSRDLAQQDDKPMGAAMQVEQGTNGIFLSDTLALKVLLTIVPNAPNNKKQFHRHTVQASDVADVFRGEFRIQNGRGPDLELFIAPGEATARFALAQESQAAGTVEELLGLDDDNPDTAGIEGVDLPGYVLMNEERYLTQHATAVATEALAAFADNIQGTLVTPVPRNGVHLKGNMSGASVRVSTAPGAKVDAVFNFPGQQRPISRFALMSNEARAIVLGTLPLEKES